MQTRNRKRLGRTSIGSLESPDLAALAVGVSPTLRSATLIAVVLQLGLFAWYLSATLLLEPFADMLDLVDVYLRQREAGGMVDHVLAPHTWHRLIWTRLLVWLDIEGFSGTGWPLVLAGLACLTGATLLLARTASAAAGPSLRAAVVALVVMLLFSTANVADVSLPANTPYLHTLLFAVVAIVLWRPGGWPIRAAPLAAAVAAAFSNAVGLVVWPALAVMALREGRGSRSWLIVVALAGAVFTTGYLYRQTGDVGMGSSINLKSADYFVAYLGLPWVRASGVLGRVIGVALLAASLYAIVRRGGPDAPVHERTAVGFILVSLGTAAMAALGRRDIADAIDVPLRYAVFMNPLHVGLMVLALPTATRVWEARPRLVEAALAAAMVALLAQQMLIGQVAAAAAARTRSVIAAFHRAERPPEAAQVVHPNLAHAAQMYTTLRRAGLYRAHLQAPPLANGNGAAALETSPEQPGR